MKHAILNPRSTFSRCGSDPIAENVATVTREVDAGLETVALKMPAVITTDLRLNVPRYASLPNIMKSKKKEIAVLPAAEMGAEITPRLTVLKVTEPQTRQTGVLVESVGELVAKLKTEAKVLS